MSFLFIQWFIFLTVCCVFIFIFVLQFQKMHKMTGVSHGKKLAAESLTVSREVKAWFWQRVNASGLAPSFGLGTRTSAIASSPPC